MSGVIRQHTYRLALSQASNMPLPLTEEVHGPPAGSVPVLPRRTDLDTQSKVVLSIVIVNWNTKESLRECLASIHAGSVDSFEVIVVDNGSEDGSVSMLKEYFPQVETIQNTDNVGFARASNQGMLLSTGDYVLLLNSDTRVPERALASMIEFMEQHREAGAMGPRLILADGRPQPYSFGDDPTLLYLLRRGLKLLLRREYLHHWGSEEMKEVDWVSGASLMLRRRALEDVGLLDEDFFLYFEDNDLCLRLRHAGWKVYFNPTAEVVHLVGESLVQNEPARAEYYRSLTRFYRKHYGRMSVMLTILLPLYRGLAELRGRGPARPPEVGC